MNKNSTSEDFYTCFIDSLQANEKIKLKEKEHYLKKNVFLSNEWNLIPCAVYLLNFQKQHYLHICEGISSFSGYSSNDFLISGHEWFLSLFHPVDAKQYKENIFKDFIHFTSNMNKVQIKHTCFSINYRIKNKDGSYIYLLDQFVILETDESGNPILILGTYNDITTTKTEPKNIFSITEINTHKGNKLIFYKVFQETLNLSPKEKEIVMLLTNGDTSKKIASTLNISIHTVNAHRRNILEKLKFKNTSELINYCLINKLF